MLGVEQPYENADLLDWRGKEMASQLGCMLSPLVYLPVRDRVIVTHQEVFPKSHSPILAATSPAILVSVI